MAETDTTIDRALLEAVLQALSSPKSYSLDGEAIENHSPEELARLISMVRQLKGESSPATSRSPFRVSVQNCNTTYDE